MSWYIVRNFVSVPAVLDLERGCAVLKDCQAHKLNGEDAMDRSRLRKLIKDG